MQERAAAGGKHARRDAHVEGSDHHPAEVRAALGVSAGDRLEFVVTATGAFEIVPATATVRSLKGLIAPPAEPVSVEEMNAAIAQRGAASR